MKIAAVLAGLTLIVVVGVAAWVSRDSDPTPPTDALAAETAEGTADSGRAPRVIAAAGGSVGDTYAVDARDGLAVFGRGTDLIVADVSDPSEPVQVGTAALGAPVRDVVLQGDLAFVASDSTGFHIVDLSDPGFPRVAASMRFDDRVYGVDTDGRHAYVAARSAGLHVLDVADPEKPVPVGHIQTPDDAVDVVVRGDFAYVAAWYESMRVIDISDPANPEEVSFASYDSYDNGTAWSVYVEGDLGFATVPDMGLRTVDISNPRDVKLHRVYRGLLAPVAVAARGRTAFVADQDAGFRVLRLDDPANPVEIGTLKIPGRAVGVVLSGDHAYVAAREGGLRVLDVSLPYRPREVGRLDPSDRIVDVAASGATVVAAGSENGVHVYRYAEGLDQVAFYPVPARRVRIRDDRIYAASETGIHLLGSAATASIVADLPAPAEGFDVSGGLIVVAGGRSGLHIYQTEQGGPAAAGDHARAAAEFHAERQLDPAREDVQLLRGPVAAWDVILAGELAYAAFDDGIRTLDLSAPDAPRMLDHLSTSQRVYRLDLVGSRLYAACDDGMRVIDVSDLSNLRELAYVKTPSFETSILVDGERVYVGDLSGVMTVVDAQNPPNRLGEWDLRGRMHALARLPEGIAIAAGIHGLRVIVPSDSSVKIAAAAP